MYSFDSRISPIYDSVKAIYGRIQTSKGFFVNVAHHTIYAAYTKYVLFGHYNLYLLQKQWKKQRTNGPVNAHLISEPSISTQHTQPTNWIKMAEQTLTLIT